MFSMPVSLSSGSDLTIAVVVFHGRETHPKPTTFILFHHHKFTGIEQSATQRRQTVLCHQISGQLLFLIRGIATHRQLPCSADLLRQVIAESEGFAGRGAWTGGELVVLVGQPGAGMDQSLAGGAYDPTRDVWRALPTDSGMSDAASVVWTGRSVAVIGGYRMGEERVEGVPPHVVELVPDARS